MREVREEACLTQYEFLFILNNLLKDFAEKIKLVPFFKIFVAIAAGAVIGLLTVNTLLPKTIAIIEPIAIMFSIFPKRKFPYILLILTGIAVTFFQTRKEEAIPHNIYVNATVSVVEIPAKERLIVDVLKIDGRPIKRERMLFVHGDELHKILREDDVVDITLMFESLNSSSIRGKSYFEDLNLDLYAHTHPDSIPVKTGMMAAKRDLIYNARKFLVHSRDKLSERLNGIDLDKTDKAVLNAIVIGKKDGLTPEIRDSYSTAGVSHIMAISGLHIGIICVLLNLLFFFIPSYGKSGVLKQILIILLLWFYVLLTGASPSACRAAFMFTLLQFTIPYKRSKYTVYNILFASATFFVLIDYTVLKSISFQLSYLAVFAILLLYDRIAAVVKIKNKFLRYFTDIIIITISVQIITAPLVMYYFGILSIISIPANIVFTLLLPVLICATLLYIAFPNIVCEQIITAIFGCYNYTIDKLTSLPWAAIKGYYITGWDILCYIFILILVWLYLSYFYKTEQDRDRSQPYR